MLKKQNKLNKFYISQPSRKRCKACNKKLKGKSFKNHKIKYIECKYCSHINGCYKDTKNFADKIYVNEKVSYSKSYYEKNAKQFLIRQKKFMIQKQIF